MSRTAIITGAARGIGAATAHRLAADGWNLVLVDRCGDEAALGYSLATEDELHAVAAATNALAVVADVRDTDALNAAAATGREKFGSLDAALAVAGVMSPGAPVWEIDDDAWRAVFDINVDGVRNLARAAVPAMLDAPSPRHGRFVAVASSIAHKATPQLGAYAASKAAVVTLVQSMAADLANTGVTANVVSPGTTNTAIIAPSLAAYDLTDVAAFSDQQIDQRVLEPSEVAATLAWLCSADAGAVNGALIAADAGLSSR